MTTISPLTFSTTAAAAPAASTPAAPTSPPLAIDPLASEQTFLQLLVAQIKNQDPTSPADAVQFVTQLAQFSQLEQMLGMRADIQGMRQDLEKNTVTPPATVQP